MPSNQTPNYQLSQWERSDKIQMEDFNADNAKIDAALSGKAEASAVDGLSQTVAALSQTVSGHTSALSGKGNCRLYVTSYTGTGGYGSSRPNTLSFPQRPEIVFVAGPHGNQAMFTRNMSYGYSTSYMGEHWSLTVSWSGNTLQWYTTNIPEGQLNSPGQSYTVVALMIA